MNRRRAMTVIVKAPRQMGKSSMLIRACHQAGQRGDRVAFLDFQKLNNSVLYNEKSFFKWFCQWIAQAFNVQNLIPKVNDVWDEYVGSVFAATDYMENHILPEIGEQRALLALDEIDRLFDVDYRSSFFRMLRNWHNNRASSSVWENLSLMMVLSTEPYLLIENLNESPFNVATSIILTDFSMDQMALLNEMHGYPLDDQELEELADLVGGHPFLVREALYEITANHCSPVKLMASATDENGPFADHLMHFSFLLSQDQQLADAMLQIIHGARLPSDTLITRLQSAGLVRVIDHVPAARCRLYRDYFARRLKA
jgi:hypothetical protein